MVRSCILFSHAVKHLTLTFLWRHLLAWLPYPRDSVPFFSREDWDVNMKWQRLNDTLQWIVLRSQERETGRRKCLEMEPVFCAWLHYPRDLAGPDITSLLPTLSVLPRPGKGAVRTGQGWQ